MILVYHYVNPLEPVIIFDITGIVYPHILDLLCFPSIIHLRCVNIVVSFCFHFYWTLNQYWMGLQKWQSALNQHTHIHKHSEGQRERMGWSVSILFKRLTLNVRNNYLNSSYNIEWWQKCGYPKHTWESKEANMK